MKKTPNSPRIWLQRIAKKSFQFISRASVESKPSGTRGWYCCIKVPKKRGLEEGLSLQIWLDAFVTGDANKRRLFYGFGMKWETYVRLFKEWGKLWPCLTDADLDEQGILLHETRVKDFNFRQTYLEGYQKDKCYFYGAYIGDAPLEYQRKEEQLISIITGFFEDGLNNEYLFKSRENGHLGIQSAEEGYLEDFRRLAYRSINISLRENVKRKRNYKCQACPFSLKLGKQWVIDIHHKTPLCMGKRETKPSDLFVLCPTCHRIAHTSKPPLKLEDIIKARKKSLPISKRTG